MLPVPVASVFGLPYQTTLLVTGVVAGLALTAVVLAILFFAWAPHVSTDWSTEFGSSRDLPDEEPAD